MQYFFLNFNVSKGQKRVLSPVNFSSGERNLRAWRGISEVYLELQIPYKAPEFTSARVFSSACDAQFSVFCVFVICCQPLNICLLVM
jgi:hypothetical protein